MPGREPVSAPGAARISEGEAIARVLAGDAEAFAPLVRRHLRLASTIGFSILGNRHDAEDLVQEDFLTALANLSAFDRTRPFGHRSPTTRGEASPLLSARAAR